MTQIPVQYAIVKAAGVQLRVREGEEIDMFRLPEPEGSRVTFPEVLLIRRDQLDVMVGSPIVQSAMVQGTIVKHYQGKKIRVATYRAKSRHRRVKGHRDQLTRVKIERIVTGNE